MAKIHYNFPLPKCIGGLTIGRHILIGYSKKSARLPSIKRLIRHEEVHVAQFEECGWNYYWLYLKQWIACGFKYREIPFEQEAYAKEHEQ